MSEDRRRRRLAPGTSGRVGDPNVLSDAATPNVLLGEAAQPRDVRVVTHEGREGWLATGATAAKPSVRLPSFGTVIFLGFLAVTGFRILGSFVQGLPEESPAASSPAASGQVAGPGVVSFGTKPDGCRVRETAREFVQGTDVWWSAELATVQSPGATVVVIVRRDGTEIDREVVPPDGSGDRWSVLCSGSPVAETAAGVYRVEVWDETVKTRHAIGEYTLTPA